MALVLIARLLLDNGDLYLSQVGIASTTFFAEPRVLSFGTIMREVPLLPESPRAVQVSIQVANQDGYFSGLRRQQRFINRTMEIILADTQKRESDFTVIFRGPISNDSLINSESMEIPARDSLGIALDRPVPFLINPISFPYLPARVPRTLVPVVLGTVASPTGAIPAYAVDEQASAGQTKFRYVAAQGVLKSITEVFVYGVELLSGFTVTTMAGPDNSLLTVIDFDTSPFDEDRSDDIEVTYNTIGLTDDGTAGGDPIVNPALQMEAVLLLLGFSASEISSSLRDSAVSQYDDLNVVGGVAITEPSKLSVVLDNFAKSFGLMLFQSSGGTIGMIAPGFEVSTATELVHIEEGIDIAQGGFSVRSADSLATGADAQFSFNFATGEYLDAYPLRDSGELGIQQAERIEPFEMPFIRDVSYAVSILNAVFFYMKEQREVVDISAMESFYQQLEIGENITLTHHAGPSVDDLGYREKRFRVIGIGISEQSGLLSTVLRVVDLSAVPPLFTLYEDDRSAPLFADLYGWQFEQFPTLPGDVLGE
jgi:hypothetical protein